MIDLIKRLEELHNAIDANLKDGKIEIARSLAVEAKHVTAQIREIEANRHT